MFPLLFAWSSEGHGQLTCAALAFAIARLVPMGRTYVMKRVRSVNCIFKSARRRGMMRGAPS
jgi:hypothetical protein